MPTALNYQVLSAMEMEIDRFLADCKFRGFSPEETERLFIETFVTQPK